MIVAIATQKGGSAKTTTTVNLGAALAERGKRVAIIDLDPQAHATFWLLGPEGRQWGTFVHEWMVVNAAGALRPSGWPGLDIIAANAELGPIRDQLDPRNRPADGRLLADRVATLGDIYDWVLIDCPASYDALTHSALLSADGVIVPVAPPEPLALDGVQHMLSAVGRIQEEHNPRLRVLGVLVANLQVEHAIQRRTLEWMEQARFPLFTTMISRSARVGAAAEAHQPVMGLAPKSFVADGYRALSMEVEKRSRGWLWNWVSGTSEAQRTG